MELRRRTAGFLLGYLAVVIILAVGGMPVQEPIIKLGMMIAGLLGGIATAYIADSIE